MPARFDHDARPPESGTVSASILSDLHAAERSGAPPLGHLAGLRRRSEDTTSYALELDPSRPALQGGPGILEVAMLADLALGGAIRQQVGLALPMPTVSMTIQLVTGRTRDVRWADGQCTAWRQRTAGARSRLFTGSGDLVGDAVGVFALPELPYEGPGREMPWDLPLDEAAVLGDEGPVVETGRDGGDLSADQEAVIERIQTHAVVPAETAWATQHVMDRLTSCDGGHELRPTPAMANRLGHVQGGVLFTAAVLAASRDTGFPVESLSTGTIEFITAAVLGSRLLPQVTVLRAGGRSLFVTVALVQDGDVRSHVSLVFRR